MHRRPLLAITLLVLCSLFLQGMPPTIVRAQGEPPPPIVDPTEPPPLPLQDPGQPASDLPEPAALPLEIPNTPIPVLPSLTLELQVLPETWVAVGDVITATLTVHNQAEVQADDLTVSMALPTDATPANPTEAGLGATGWRWVLGTLPSQGQTVVTATLVLTAVPSGEALVLEPQVLARGLDLPIVAVGGALVTADTAGVHPTARPAVAPTTAAAIAEPPPATDVTTPSADASSSAAPAADTTAGLVATTNSAVQVTSVVQAAPARIRFTPGRPVTLSSRDHRISVRFPGNAFDRPLNLDHFTFAEQRPRLRARGQVVPTADAGNGRGLGAFFLEATDDAGSDIHQFKAPLTISVHITPEQLRVLHIAPDALTLYWFDTSQVITDTNGRTRQGQWMPIPTAVDMAAGTATATVEHFTGFELSDGTSASSAFLPSLQGWQVSGFTGALNFSYPIDVPAGPGGLKPDLNLSYSSAATDGAGGMRTTHQAGWVGRGWSLDTGSIALNKVDVSGTTQVNHYALSFNGRSFDLVRGAALVANPVSDNPTNWEWHPADESYIKVRAISNGDSSPGGIGAPDRGASHYATMLPRYVWLVWDKSGMLYTFAEDMWWGWSDCSNSSGDFSFFESNRWLLSSITDPMGNTVTYRYQRANNYYTTCLGGAGTIDFDVWPTTITWAGGRYKVDFISSARTNDTQYEQAPHTVGAPVHETRRLDVIRVSSMQAATWQIVREYRLIYTYSLFSDARICAVGGCANGWRKDAAYPKLTLASVQRIGAYDGSPASVPSLPATSFVYGTSDGTAFDALGGWNRLISVDNGQGGTLSIQYENIAAVTPGDNLFRNYHRVVLKTAGDGLGHTYSWNYSYGTPLVNTLGTTLGDTIAGVATPTSAALYYNTFLDGDADTDAERWLVHRVWTEFLGHDWTRETGPDGATTTHFFYQGNHACVPAATAKGSHAAIIADACFQAMQREELLKGREYQTEVRSAGGALLKRTLHTFAVGPVDYTWAPLAGLWRTFSYEAATEEQLLEGGSTSSSVKHLYTYDLTQNTNLNGVIYGNLSKDETYLNGVRYRIAMFFYTGVDTGVDYLVDRVRTSVQWDGAWNTLAFTARFYDGSNSDGGIGSCSGASSCGLLTRESALFDVPLQNNLAGLSLHSRDTSYGYDAYGNQTSTTTYTGPGSAVLSGSTWGYSAPGSGSSARTSITAYDPTYHALPISQTNPLGQSQTATYDWRMGTLTKVTDANAIDTTATYDALGRMITLVKPGDSAAFPTLTASYDDGAFPFRYRYLQREVAGAGGMRWTQVFYDGMGRQIETKVESRDIAPYQNTDTFTAYDGLGRVTQQSQPLFVDEADVNVFLEYTNPSGVSGVRWTSLTYDGLGRVRTQTDPGGKVTTHTYSIASGNLSDHTLVDAQQHRVHQQSDGLGRLVKVIEDAGTGAWSTYATTSYAYTPLDLLDTATDAQGNVTDLDYDSLGRKTRSVDPDMGTWYYTYDQDGNLVTQTDASQRTQVFNYDALGRLTSRMAEDSGPTSTFADGFDAQSSLNWTWSSYQSVASSMVSSTGSGSGWNAEFSRSSYDLSDGDGLALSLKLSGTNPNAIFAVETGSGAAYRRLQLLVLNGQFGTQTTLDGSNYTTFTPLMSVQANVWYRLTMTLDDRAGFRVQVAQDGAPQTRATQLISMPPGQSWRFHHWIYAANTATIDSYSEYQGPRYGYDQGTNGKGRRTSMALGTGAGALASTSWSYDSRGRVTNTREDVSGLPSSGRSFSRSYDSADRVVSQSFPAANSAAAETLSYAYDAGWRQTSVCSSLGGCYAQSASYLASGQPNAWTLGNGLVQNWMYDVLNRPVRLQLGTSASVSTADNLSAAAADRFDRQYSFDDVGNVLSLTDKRGAQPLQSYVYDARDRLTSWTLGGTTQSYTYDLIGNLTSKAGISQTYGSTGLGSGTGPHQARSVGGATYSYDATGNLISGGGRNIAWNTDNLPYTVTSGGVPEGYLYNADSARVKKVRGSVSTYYLDGMWEEDSTGMVRKYYTLGDQTVASRTVTSTTNAVSYLQGDNLGSVSLTTDASGVAGTPQEFDPWGKVRSGVISATRRNYTGQYLDDTGLLFYNAALRHFLWS